MNFTNQSFPDNNFITIYKKPLSKAQIIQQFGRKMSQKHPNQTGKNNDKKGNKKIDKKGPEIKRMTNQQQEEAQAQNIKNFFSRKLQMSKHFINIDPISQNITSNIMDGNLKVPQQSKRLETLIRPPEQFLVKITDQEQKMYEKQAKRIEHLKLISNINKQLLNKQTEDVIPYIFTKQEHYKKVRQIVDEKKQRERKIDQIKQIMREKQEKQQKQIQQHKKVERLQQKQKKRIQIQEKITKQKEDHIHFLSQDIKHRKDLEELVSRVPLHVKMQDNFKATIQIPELQQKKNEYKQMRDFKRQYSVDSIIKFQQQHSKRLNQRLQKSKLTSRISLNSIPQSLKLKLGQKSQHLKSILAEQIWRNRQKIIEKQIYFEEKTKRQQNYLKKLREQHKPKIDLQKKRQIQLRLLKEKEHLSKVGLLIDRKQIGLSYLGQVKKEAQKSKQLHRNEQSDLQSKQYRSESLPSIKSFYSQSQTFTVRKNNEALQKLRQKRLSNILNSEQQSKGKFQKIKLESQKIQQAKQMKLGFLKHNFDQNVSKQASSLALSSIKAKMGLISLMKNQ